MFGLKLEEWLSKREAGGQEGIFSRKPKKVAEKTKETASSLLKTINNNATGVSSLSKGASSSIILDGIYKLLIKNYADDKIQDELDDDKNDSRHYIAQRRHNEIIAALSYTGKIKKTRVKERKRITAKPKEEEPEKIDGSSILSMLGKYAIGGAVVGAGVFGYGIAKAESGGDYNVAFGDRKDKSGKYINAKGLPTPEEFSGGKKLTEMTLSEVKQFGAARSAISPNSGATGAYQFMPSTLFGTSKSPGLVQRAGLSMDTKYTPETQEILHKKLEQENRETLTRMGVPITPGNEYMAWYIGPGGALAVHKNTDPNKTVAEVMADAKLVAPGKANNPELYSIKAVEFESILSKRVGGTTSSPQSAPKTTGTNIESSSKTNQQLRKDISSVASSSVTNNQTNVNMSQSGAKSKYVDEDGYDWSTHSDMSAVEKIFSKKK